MMKVTYSQLFVSMSFLAMLAVVSFNFYVDPFTYYHAPWASISLSNNHRYSNPGLARQLDYSVALVGTSHVLELESSRLSEIMGEPAINLSTNGSLIREQAQLVELVLQQGKANTLLWEMNYPSFDMGDIVVEFGEGYPQYFYTPTIETPFRYLMSFDTLMQSINALGSPDPVTLDSRNQASVRTYSEDRVLANWDFKLKRWDEELSQVWAENLLTIETPSELIERRILPVIKQYPEVQFKLFVPPTSVLMFLLFEYRGDSGFLNWLELRDALARLTATVPNVELYDFHSDWEIISNLDLYRDLGHFNQTVMKNMFVQMSLGEKQVNKADMLINSQQLRKQVKRYGKTFCNSVSARCPDRLRTRVELMPSSE
jgi:hypothetical protein